jgi:hypothetical protein
MSFTAPLSAFICLVALCYLTDRNVAKLASGRSRLQISVSWNSGGDASVTPGAAGLGFLCQSLGFDLDEGTLEPAFKAAVDKLEVFAAQPRW